MFCLSELKIKHILAQMIRETVENKNNLDCLFNVKANLTNHQQEEIHVALP